MFKQQRQAWLIVAVLFAALAFIFSGTIATPGIFFASLIREFGWSHARVSLLASSVMLGTIPGSLAAGFLLERYDTRSSMVAGAALTAGSLLFASQADSYLPFLISYFFAGFGVAMATLLPAALVVANWFQAKRGMAMGVAIAGVSVGGMIMVQVAAAVIQAGGWRAAYTALALPVLLVVIPLVLLVVRTRPPEVSVQGLSAGSRRVKARRGHPDAFALVYSGRRFPFPLHHFQGRKQGECAREIAAEKTNPRQPTSFPCYSYRLESLRNSAFARVSVVNAVFLVSLSCLNLVPSLSGRAATLLRPNVHRVVVLNCWVTATNETPRASKTSTILAKSASERVRRSTL